MEWNTFDAAIAGAKGGAKTSEAKRRAAQKNGKSADAGRPRNTTLAEHILRRKLTREQHGLAREGYVRLSLEEQKTFRKFFGLEEALMYKVPYGSKRGRRKLTVQRYFDAATTVGIRPTKASPRMRMILKKFRLTARHLLAGGR